mgnify:CR=1 FL=1
MRSREPKCPIANMVCPRNNDPEKGAYCPAWTEYTETNHQTGEDRIQKECMFTAMPKFMAHTLAAANRPAAAIESTRNEIAKGFSQVSEAVSQIPQITQNRED